MKLQDGDVFKIVSKDTELMCPQEPCGAPIFVASAANFIFGKYNTHAAAYATNARFVAFLGTFARYHILRTLTPPCVSLRSAK